MNTSLFNENKVYFLLVLNIARKWYREVALPNAELHHL